MSQSICSKLQSPAQIRVSRIDVLHLGVQAQNAILDLSRSEINLKKIHFETAVNFETIQLDIFVVPLIKFFFECIFWIRILSQGNKESKWSGKWSPERGWQHICKLKVVYREGRYTNGCLRLICSCSNCQTSRLESNLNEMQNMEAPAPALHILLVLTIVTFREIWITYIKKILLLFIASTSS